MRKCLLLVTSLFASACGDNLQPTDDEAALVAENPEREISAFVSFTSASCDSQLADLEVVARYVDTGEPFLASCTFTFADGSTADGCLVQHEFSSSGAQTVEVDVTDPLTGATTHVTQDGFVYPVASYDLEVSTPACGLEISYNATIDIGAETHVFVEPPEKVVADPLYHLQRQNTVGVTEPGTYTVRYTIEDERQVGPVCLYEMTKEVTVTACPTDEPGDDHEHTPSCGH